MNMHMLLEYLLTGALAGTMSGLLGIGGGIVVVPALASIFLHNGDISKALYMKMAIGTSLAIMVVTLASGVYAHHKRGAVNSGIVKTILPGLIIGVILGAIIVRFLPSTYLSIFFSVFLLVIGLRLLFKKRDTSTGIPAPHVVSKTFLWILSSLIGILSSLLGAGGGTMWVPFFLSCKLTMHEAVGTSIACAIVAAMIATASFMIVGLFSTEIMPSWSTSYIYWPAFFGVAATSVFFAPLGAALAHRLPQEILKKIFAIFILLVAADMMFFTK